MIILLGATALAAVCCVFLDRRAWWLERLSAVVGVLAMLDSMLFHVPVVPKIAWVGVLVLLAVSDGVRLRFAAASDWARMVALHRALGLLAIAGFVGTGEQPTPVHGMSMGAGLGATAIAVGYLASTAIMVAHASRRRAEDEDRRSAVRAVNLIEAAMMTIMLVAMVGPAVSA